MLVASVVFIIVSIHPFEDLCDRWHKADDLVAHFIQIIAFLENHKHHGSPGLLEAEIDVDLVTLIMDTLLQNESSLVQM